MATFNWLDNTLSQNFNILKLVALATVNNIKRSAKHTLVILLAAFNPTHHYLES